MNPGPDYGNYETTALLETLRFLNAYNPLYELPEPSDREGIISALSELNQHVVSHYLNHPNETQRPGTNAIQSVPVSSSSAPPQILPRPDKRDTVKLPNFYEKDVRLWFQHIEHVLEGKPEDVKKRSLLATLNTEMILEAGLNLDDEFNDLKKQFIKTMSDSEEIRLKRMLQDQELGDRKPSTALRHLQHLAPNSDAIVRVRFIEMMPANVRLILTPLVDTPIQQLAETADRLMESLGTSSAPVMSAASVDPTPIRLIDQIALLTQQVQALSTPGGGRTTFRQRSQSRSRKNANGVCWYHQKFGKDAQKCLQPCSFPDKSRIPGNSGAPSL